MTHGAAGRGAGGAGSPATILGGGRGRSCQRARLDIDRERCGRRGCSGPSAWERVGRSAWAGAGSEGGELGPRG